MAVLEDNIGKGYSIPTPGMVEAVKLFLRVGGVLICSSAGMDRNDRQRTGSLATPEQPMSEETK